MGNYNNYLLDAMELMIDKKIENAPFAREEVGTIVEVLDNGEYIVSVDGERFKVESPYIGLKELSKVYITTRGSNKNKKRISGTLNPQIVTSDYLDDDVMDLTDSLVYELKNIMNFDREFNITYVYSPSKMIIDKKKYCDEIEHKSIPLDTGYNNSFWNTTSSINIDDIKKLDAYPLVQGYDMSLYATQLSEITMRFGKYLKSDDIDIKYESHNYDYSSVIASYKFFNGSIKHVYKEDKISIYSNLNIDEYVLKGLSTSISETATPFVLADENGYVNVKLSDIKSLEKIYGYWEKKVKPIIFDSNPDDGGKIIETLPSMNMTFKTYGVNTSDGKLASPTAKIRFPHTIDGEKLIEHWIRVGHPETPYNPNTLETTIIYDDFNDFLFYPVYL